jgi:hypothetical protein
MLLNGSLSACGFGDCLNSYCFTLIGSIVGGNNSFIINNI